MRRRRGRRHKQILNNLRKRGNTGNGKRNHWIAPCGAHALEAAMNLPYDRLLNEWMNE